MITRLTIGIKISYFLLSWRTSDVTADIDQVDKASQVSEIIAHLKPFTQYAVYVQTYTIASANRGAMSDIVYFTTMSDGQ